MKLANRCERTPILLVVRLTVLVVPAGAEPGMSQILESLECDRVLSAIDAHSAGDRGVRVDEIKLCIRHASDQTVLVFRATSTREHFNYPSRRHAPGLGVTIVSASGERTVLPVRSGRA